MPRLENRLLKQSMIIMTLLLCDLHMHRLNVKELSVHSVAKIEFQNGKISPFSPGFELFQVNRKL